MKKLAQEQVKQAMDRVLEVRYSDSVLQRSLCLELLAWGEECGDGYAIAFAHTYLGDFFIGEGDTVHCAPHLLEARELAVEGKYDDLLARACCLLGLYYEMIADGQSSLKYFMEAITAARREGNAAIEGLILNNIANNFQRNRGYKQALKFYQEAHALMQHAEDDGSPTACIILSNLASVSICLGQVEGGKAYIRQCEALDKDSEVSQTLCSQNWCQYYTATGDEARAMERADLILSRAERDPLNQIFAFDLYAAFFDCMMRLRNAPTAFRFLALMETCCMDASPEQRRQIEDARMAYCLAFEANEEKCDAAYQRYCQQTLVLNKQGDQVITSGMRDAIRLFRVARQKELLDAQQSDLKHQVNLDELTQVYTRRYLEELIRQQENNPTPGALGFIMADVDCLKEYNDTYGHPDGDKVLRAVGACLRAHAADTVYPCRFGGDEFVCLCVGMTDTEIVEYIRAVRDDLQKQNISHCASHCAPRVTLSIGFSNDARSPRLSPHTLLEWADKALYTSKNNGRNTYRQHSE